MDNLKHNLFIINNDSANSMPLMNFLHNKFGNNLQITCYQSSEYALSKIGAETHIVILDSILEGRLGNTMIQSIKKINPKTEVIVLSSHEDIALAIQSFRQGANNYVVNNKNGYKAMANLIYNILLYPVRILFREFRVRKYLAIFFLTFFYHRRDCLLHSFGRQIKDMIKNADNIKDPVILTLPQKNN